MGGVRFEVGNAGTTQEVGSLPDAPWCSAVLVRPPAPPVGAIVICPPVLDEVARDLHRELEIARALATHGYFVLRFDYRSSGDSEGDDASLEFERMVEDVGSAIDAAISETGVDSVTLLGVRVGALAAAVAAARHAAAVRLVLVDPVASGSAWVRERYRAERLRKLDPGQSRRTPDELQEELAAYGQVDVGRNRFHRAFVDSIEQVDLAEAVSAAGPCTVLCLQYGDSPRPPWPSLEGVVAAARGAARVVTMGEREVWSMTDDRAALGLAPAAPDARQTIASSVADAVHDWLLDA